ncbi:MAG: nucleotidyltransferase domain-containing protein [Candidatus Micrarchaeota archaeon]
MAKFTQKSILGRLDTLKPGLARLGVKRIGLFGSYAAGKQTSRSDLDFIVEFEKPTFDSFMDLKELLETAFGKRVDLVTVGGLKPSLRHIGEQAAYAQVS